nr:chemotaxis protein CheW [Gammaproteobacteria bacterium]
MTQARELSSGPTCRWVTFSLDGETYGIDVLQVQEVLRLVEIAPVPGAPDYVLGIINLRGTIVTVLDTHRRFGLSTRPSDDATRIIIIEAKQQIVGILVDSVAEVLEIRQCAIEPAPNVGGQEKARFIHGLYSGEDRLLILIDVNKLLSDSEWTELEAW